MKNLTSLFVLVGLAAVWSAVAAWHMGWALLALPAAALLGLLYLMIRQRKVLSLKLWLGVTLCVAILYPMSVFPVSGVFKRAYGPRWYVHYRKYVAPIDYLKQNVSVVNEIRIWYVKTWLKADRKREKAIRQDSGEHAFP